MKRNNLFDQHTLDIFNAAMPHIHPAAQNEFNVLLKANDLMSTLNGRGRNGELSTMDLQDWKPDPEEMLVSIKEVLNEGETEMVDMILNFMKARRIYSAYQTYSDNTLQAQAVGGNGGGMGNNRRRNPFGMNNQRNNSANNSANNSQRSGMGNQSKNQNQNNQAKAMGGSGNQMPNFMNFLMSQMSPEQRQSFQMFSQMMNNMPNMDNGRVTGQNVRSGNENSNKVKSQAVDNQEPEASEEEERS